MQSKKASQAIRFLLNNNVVEADEIAPTTSILSFIRQDRRLMGTKEGCAEGDCGACTVVIGELKHDRLVLKPVNACIQFVPTLDGKALFTVEYLRSIAGDLHPVQQAMVECHGSQCGFCTPGFVMSLWGLYLSHVDGGKSVSPDDSAVRQAITGNLCRCTGYRPIIEAGKRMCDLPKVSFDREALANSLRSLQSTTSLHYQYEGRHFHSPTTLAELTVLRADMPAATMLAGGTDVGLWVNKHFRDLGDIIHTGEVAELNAIAEDTGGVTIGAAVSLNDTYAALKDHYPEMNEMWERFASVPIRNAGTLGGNIANGSPIGDSMPALIALGASVTVASSTKSRLLPLEDLYVAYQQKAMQSDEVLVSVRIPRRSPALRFRNYKLSKRFDSDISAVCAAFAIELDGDNISTCRIAFGGMAATPRRALQTEKRMIGQKWDEKTVRDGMEALSTAFTPLTDMRASAGYRVKTAQNLLYRFFLETRPVDAMAADELSVFA